MTHTILISKNKYYCSITKKKNQKNKPQLNTWRKSEFTNSEWNQVRQTPVHLGAHILVKSNTIMPVYILQPSEVMYIMKEKEKHEKDVIWCKL